MIFSSFAAFCLHVWGLGSLVLVPGMDPHFPNLRLPFVALLHKVTDEPSDIEAEEVTG